MDVVERDEVSELSEVDARKIQRDEAEVDESASARVVHLELVALVHVDPLEVART